MTAVAGSWIADTPELLRATRWDHLDQVWVYLIAEVTPDGSWDWTAWSSDDSRTSLHGVANDRADAMAHAEQAAVLIRRARVLAEG